MKELGEFLKEHRESNGVGLEEASIDLNISLDDLENIEEGNIRAFRDVLSLKDKIRLYAKYLGLDPEKVADEFNDFMFEHTSKISLSDILEAEKKMKDNVKKVRSPYTIIRKKRLNRKKLFVVIGLGVLLILLLIIIIKLNEPKRPVINKELKNRGEIYEYSYKINCF